MTPIVTTQLTGVSNVVAVLRQLPTNVAGKLVKPAMQRAGQMLTDKLHWNAFQQLQGARGRGYKDRDEFSLYKTAGSRVKSYRKGNTTFVAIGFSYKAGGYHGHLVEMGHRIVRGGSLPHGRSPGDITAAGSRYLQKLGWKKGNWESGVVLHGRRKGKPRINRGSWKGPLGDVIYPPEFMYGRRLRGGGVATGGMTRKYPMLGPAFQVMQGPMLAAIEQELRKILPEAVRLAKNMPQGFPSRMRWGSGKSSAG